MKRDEGIALAHSSAQSTTEKIKSSVTPFCLRIFMILLNTISLHISLMLDNAKQIVARINY